MPFSNEIKVFISKYIGSTQQLEVLLAVYSEPDREWTSEDISRKVGLDIMAVTNRVLSLCVKGLVYATEKTVRTFRYRPKDNSTDAMVHKLKILHEEDPLKLIQYIEAQAERRLRDFSDAFKLKQEDEHD